MLPKSEFDSVCRQVHGGQADRGRSGWNHHTAEQQYQVEMWTQPRAQTCMFPVARTCTSFPSSSHTQSQSCSRGSRQKVGGAWTTLKFSQSSSERLRFRKFSMLPSYPGMPDGHLLFDKPTSWFYPQNIQPQSGGWDAEPEPCGDPHDAHRP